MSNSLLVHYTKLSPNCNKPRNRAIDTITIHHMAGNCTVEVCGSIFAQASRGASSNYGIGSDGRIGLYVEEKNRSWCSSSGANDHRAITIEVANDGGAETGWHVSGEALDALITLAADICMRNGIERLIWSDDKNDRVNHRNGCNMTVHRDFAATECPGDYLYGKQGYIADEVNKRLGVFYPDKCPIGDKEAAAMKGVRYIGDFNDALDAAMVCAVIAKGGHTCVVVPYHDKWGVLVTRLKPGVGLGDFVSALELLAGCYNCDPKLKK